MYANASQRLCLNTKTSFSTAYIEHIRRLHVGLLRQNKRSAGPCNSHLAHGNADNKILWIILLSSNLVQHTRGSRISRLFLTYICNACRLKITTPSPPPPYIESLIKLYTFKPSFNHVLYSLTIVLFHIEGRNLVSKLLDMPKIFDICVYSLPFGFVISGENVSLFTCFGHTDTSVQRTSNKSSFVIN